ncbi:MAG: hypothetical protein CSB55_00305 [Candidatus Cloacimonadota bacterium]|nr:MAG: hypothetical protein CSB55_00305 [Candidatus Cloacimonadota bacterium]
MQYLLLGVLSSVLTGVLLKIFSTRKDSSIYVVFAGNYAAASAISFFSSDIPLSRTLPLDLFMGVILGFFLLGNFLIYQKNIKLNGLSLSVGVMRASMVIPVLLSLFLFGEKIKIINFSGILLILMSFAIQGNMKNFRESGWLIFLFLCSGITDSFSKVYNVFGQNTEALFLFYAFGSSFLINIALIVIKKEKAAIQDILYGFLLGIPNQLTFMLFIKSLKTVPAVFAYPVFSSLVVTGSFAVDLIVWRDSLSKKKTAVIGLIIAGVILLNIR